MKLSLSHSRVALFDSPGEVSLDTPPFSQASGEVVSSFRVGPFEYEAMFEPVPTGNRTYEYGFYLVALHGSEQEIHETLERVWEKKIEPEEVDRYYRALLNNATSVTGTGHASQVLGHALAILQEFITTQKPYCVYFSSYEQSRSSLYAKMIQRYLSGATLESKMRDGSMYFYLYPQGKARGRSRG